MVCQNRFTRQKDSNNNHMPQYEKKDSNLSPMTIANTSGEHSANRASDLVNKSCFSVDFKMFKEVKTSKATEIDNLAGRFLKNGWKSVLFSQMKSKIAEV